MNRIFHHYSLWEDYLNGMYNSTCDEIEEKVNLSAQLLSEQERFLYSADKMVFDWVHSSDVFLSNGSINRLAWIGQATCCYDFGSPEFVTVIAWRKLSSQVQSEANKTAKTVLNKWLRREYGENAKTLF